MKRKGRKRANVAITLPAVIFITLRNIGVKDSALARELGISRATITRVCSGLAPCISLSREEFAKFQAFAARKAAEAHEAVAALGLRR